VLPDFIYPVPQFGVMQTVFSGCSGKCSQKNHIPAVFQQLPKLFCNFQGKNTNRREDHCHKAVLTYMQSAVMNSGFFHVISVSEKVPNPVGG